MFFIISKTIFKTQFSKHMKKNIKLHTRRSEEQQKISRRAATMLKEQPKRLKECDPKRLKEKCQTMAQRSDIILTHVRYRPPSLLTNLMSSQLMGGARIQVRISTNNLTCSVPTALVVERKHKNASE